MRCPECSSSVAEGSRFCGACGSALDPSSAPTLTSPRPRAAASPGPRAPSSPPSDEARFLPGAMVAGRYRMLALLGRGGMGEVYRADDLKLGQPVALKFLPSELADDAARLERFLGEVKLARQVSHPNVCRVYDVGEADGHHYLSMEFVDGEDLASLLQRIGRVPEDKAVQIARQLCAGLAAAHEQGILHRDLKPANVMLDGRGRAKLTDFGLAELARDLRAGEAYAGTPAYMSPEQAAGQEISARSDLYSLGLVLYELFTGRRAFDAGSLAELRKQQLEATPTTPSSVVRTIDPAIESVLLHCLEKDPDRRPASALAVAAALPGGDPLGAALAAGETPSPEMVAAAGPQGGLRPGVAAACLAAILVSVLNTIPARSFNPHDHLPFVKSYEALKENARAIAARLGYDGAPAYSWAGFGYDWLEYLHLVQEHGPGALEDHLGLPGQAVFWMDYRQDDGPITPLTLDGRVDWRTPAPTAGEVAMEVDLQGHLTELRVTPSWQESGEEAPEADWSLLFEVAGLDLERFEPASPTTRPDGFADTRRAWTGTLPGYGDRPVRIEAAALDGRPISFKRILSSDPRWTTAGAQQPEVATGLFAASGVLFVVFCLAVVGGALFLAMRNVKLGRGDRRGAFRIAVFVFAMRSLHWALGGDHVPHPDEVYPLAVAVSGATTLAVLAWIVYMACEPYVRRLWPEALVSWTRVLAGRFRDPLVGRDVLIGCTFATVQGIVVVASFWIGAKTGIVGLVPLRDALIVLRGGRYVAGEIFSTFLLSTAFALGLMMVFLLFRMIFRKTWIAGVALALLWGGITALQFAGLFGPAGGLFGLLFQAFNAGVSIVLLVRFGLLATVTGTLYVALGRFGVLTFDPAAPHFGVGLLVLLVSWTVAVYGWYLSQAGHTPARGPLTA